MYKIAIWYDSFINGKCLIVCHESCKSCDVITEKDCLSYNDGFYLDKQNTGRY